MDELDASNIDMDTLKQRAIEQFGQNSAHDEISLQDKMIEPHQDDLYCEHVNRNLQLGNFDRNEYHEALHDYNIATKWLNIPDEFGGVDFCHLMAKTKLANINMSAVLSNSVDALARKEQGIRRLVLGSGNKKQRGGFLKGSRKE